MPPPPDDPLFAAFVSSIVFNIFASWVLLGIRWRWYGSLLPYEPRRPVPWGPIGAVLAGLLVLNAIVADAVLPAETPAVVPDAPLKSADAPADPAAEKPERPQQPEEPDGVRRIVQTIVVFPLIVGGVLAAIAVFSGATRRDLGMPTHIHEFARDVAIGLFACFAVLPPVYGVLAVLYQLFNEQTHHPLIETVMKEASPAILLLATVSAVIVAPVCEEIIFRLLLQGWLEKVEDAARARTSFISTAPQAEAATDDGVAAASGETTGEATADVAFRHSADSPVRRGWVPIGISSTLFALAHIGQGTAPVALVFLAIALGYTYQRTHRIVPCIVTHATFNLLNMTALWLSMPAHGA